MKLIYITKTNKFYSFANQHFAQVAELVDALDSKSSFFGSVGSIPTLSTKRDKFKRDLSLFVSLNKIYFQQNV